MILYSYWRSSSSYRVRIALAWKGLAYKTRAVNLVGNAQFMAEYRALNPQARVPWLVDGPVALGQSLAIIEYLDEAYPDARLMPVDIGERARVRAAAQLIACDIQPLGNLGVLRRLQTQFGADQAATDAWAAYWIAEGLNALESTVADGPYLFGETVTLADVCLVPQIMNARRFGVDLRSYPRLITADAVLRDLPAFAAARPEVQPDAR